MTNINDIKNIAAIGGWVIISLFFMGQAAGYLPSMDMRTYSALKEHDSRQELLISKLADVNERLTTALRVLCENAARNLSESNNCRNIR